MERFFEEMAEVGNSGRTLTPEEWTDLYARHDQFMVADRLRAARSSG